MKSSIIPNNGAVGVSPTVFRFKKIICFPNNGEVIPHGEVLEQVT
jgi:hypothetical protein